jgi:hypothetical protein
VGITAILDEPRHTAVAHSRRFLMFVFLRSNRPGLCNANNQSKQRSAILVRVLMFVCFVVPNDTSCRSTRSAVTGHVTGNATDYRTFNASLGIGRGACSDGDAQYEQCSEHLHCGSP